MSGPGPGAARQGGRIVADDLTGALDTVAVLGRQDSVPVCLGLLPPEPRRAAAVAALATVTRDGPAETLATRLAPAARWLAGAALPYKKLDSLLRGNSFAELAALLQGQQRLTRIVFAPAFPAQGRFTAGDRHWVGPPQDPAAPALSEVCASLGAAFAAVGLTARGGRTLADCGEAQVLIPQVLHDADLDALAAHWREPRSAHWLWAGSAGLAAALARQGAWPPEAPNPEAGRSAPAAPPPGPALTLVSCSRHPVLRAQLAALRALHPGWFVDIDRLEDVPPPGPRVLDLSPDQPLAVPEAARLLFRRAEQLVRRLPRPDNLLVVGGDTLLALCQAAGVGELLAQPARRGGWGLAQLCGGPWDGLACHSRSGAFGGPQDLVELMHSLASTAFTLTKEYPA